MTVSGDRTAVVIGASSGIGASTARLFAEEGWSVLLAARRTDRLRALQVELASDSGATVSTAQLDVTDDASVQALADSLADAGPAEIDAVVYCAGFALGSDPVAKINSNEVAAVYDVNVIGLARTVRALSPYLRTDLGTTIVSVTSMSGHQIYPGGGSYVAAKHAQVALLETIRQELQGDGVRVVEISPGVVRTEFALVKARGDADLAESAYVSVVPLEPSDVADCVLWAVSRPPRVDVRSISVAPRLRSLNTD